MKKPLSKLILAVFLSFAVFFIASAQKQAKKERSDRLFESSDNVKVRGTVTAFNNYYVNNVEVTSRKTKSNAYTDSLGRFEISAFGGDVLNFKANGFENNLRKVASDEDEISVNMVLVPDKKNKKLVVGYGHMIEKDLAYALEHYTDLNNDYMKYSDMKELLQKELVGVKVVDMGEIQVFMNGNEGYARSELYEPRVIIKEHDKAFNRRAGEEIYVSNQPLGTRISDSWSYKDVYNQGEDIGSGGLSQNGGAAIFVLDGRIVSSIDFLHPGDVKSVKLLRNVGTAKYGSKGAYVVVLINTKHM